MQLPHKRSFAAEELARRKKKKPTLWIIIGCVVAVSLIAGYMFYRVSRSHKQTEIETERIRSIAVLPFEDLSPEKQEWFSDGIHEEILINLSQIKEIKLISRGSVIQYKNTIKSNRDIAVELGVNALLEGTVQKIGNRVRITAQLINTKTDYHLFSRVYEREIDDFFALRRDIAHEIAGALKVELSSSEIAQIDKTPTESREAFELYLLGRYHFNRRTADGHEKAYSYFNDALERDPNFALAYVGLADIYLTPWAKRIMPPGANVRETIRDLAQKAIQIDSTCAEAYVSLAWNDLYLFDCAAAEKHFKRALELSPHNAQAHQWYSDYLLTVGKQEEAFAELLRAQELDPLNPLISSVIMRHYHFQGKDDKAIAQFYKTESLDPEYGLNFVWVSEIYEDIGNYDDAINAYKKGAEIIGTPPSIVEEQLGYLYAEAGHREEAEQILRSLKKRIPAPLLPIAKIYIGLEDRDNAQEILREMMKKDCPSWDIAEIFLRLDDIDKAMEWYVKAIDERKITNPTIIFRPLWSPIRSHPGFKELRTKMGIHEE